MTAQDVIAERVRIITAGSGPDAYPHFWAKAIYDALTAAGYVIVKLPEPDMDGEHVWSETDGHPVSNWFSDDLDGERVAACCGEVRLHLVPDGMKPVRARALAARLIAAAAHAEAVLDD